MSGSRIVVSVIVLCAAVATAAAEDVPAEADVRRAMEQGRNSEAFALATRRVDVLPADPDARYLAALTSLAVYESERTVEHLDRGLKLAPEHPRLLGLDALRRMQYRQYADARAQAERALALDPDEVHAADVIATIGALERARARRDGGTTDPSLAPGSPAELADRFVAALFDGADPARLAPMVDGSAFAELGGARDEASMRQVLTAAIDVNRRGFLDSEVEYVGWFVIDSQPIDHGRAYVRVALPIESVNNRPTLEQLLRNVENPLMRRVVPAHQLAVFDGVPPEDRRALVERMIGTREIMVAELGLELSPRGGAWAVSDVVMNGVSFRAQVIPVIKQALPGMDWDRMAASRKEASATEAILWAAVRGMGWGLLVAAGIYAFRRLRARR